MSKESSNEHMHNLTEVIASLNLAIKKISINEREMKTVLQQRKTVLVETKFIHYLFGSIDALLAKTYVLELMWQEQFANGDMGHLKNQVSPLFFANSADTGQCI